MKKTGEKKVGKGSLQLCSFLCSFQKQRVATSKIPGVVYEGSWRSFDRYGFYGSDLIIGKQGLRKPRQRGDSCHCW